MAITCPKCNKDDLVQKVSAIVLSGQSSGTFSGPSGGVASAGGKVVVAGGYTTLSGTSVTAIAKLLSKPIEPQIYKTKGITIFLGIIMIVGGILSLWLITISEDMIFPFCLGAFGLIFGPFLFFMAPRMAKQDAKKNEEEEQTWKRKISMWNAAYYCFRDDLVFDPNTGETWPPQSFSNFLGN